ncbi:MAG: transcription termination/antitermination protein NusA [Firmicutes bacterium]|nr:transcription termination/antitermination protein NusA [Bacillota bacterium]
MNKEFLDALAELERTKGIKLDILLEALEDALISAYKKNYGSSQNVRVEINRETGDIHVYYRKEVVETVENDKVEMSLEEARLYDPEFEVGDMFESEVTPRSFGRIAAQTAKQVIVQRIREAERNVIYDAYAKAEGEIVRGTIVRIEGRNVIVDIGKTEAVLTTADQIPGERYIVGNTVKVYVEEVMRGNRGTRIAISRTQPGFLSRLLEQEVPEIYDGVVEIKAVVRDPGSRAKVAVVSHDADVDAVGACVGTRGMRVQNIVEELSGEKLEIVEWSEDLATFISHAISPAKALKVTVDEENRFASVLVADNQLSLAIGRRGQNARLAVRLTACKIDIKSESQMAVLAAAQEEEIFAEEPAAEQVIATAETAENETLA